jgi:Protein of unknown function (DUF3987)
MSPPNVALGAQVRALLADAPEITPRDTWPEPDMRLISDDRVPAPSLDVDTLPEGWEEWISFEATARSVPPDYVAAGLIGAASAWIGNSRRISATPTWSEPAHLWFALIGAPSTGKTPAPQPVIETSHVLERDAEPAWRKSLATYEHEAEAARALDKAWRQSLLAAAKAAVKTKAGNLQKPSRPRGAIQTSTKAMLPPR